jgi:transcription termination factor Rho
MTSTSRPRSCASFRLRTGDTIEGVMQAPKENEKYFSMTKVTRINFDDPEKAGTRCTSTT